MLERGEKVKGRLHFLCELCISDLSKASNEVKRKVNDMVERGVSGGELPDYLQEVESEVGPNELKQYLLNHEHHM